MIRLATPPGIPGQAFEIVALEESIIVGSITIAPGETVRFECVEIGDPDQRPPLVQWETSGHHD